MTVEEIVQRQVDAYNDRDLDRFVAMFGEKIAVYRMPAADPALSGKTQFAEFYATQRFNRAGLRAEIVNRIVLGNKVIDHERIWGIHEAAIEIVVVYAIAGGLIQRMWTFTPE